MIVLAVLGYCNKDRIMSIISAWKDKRLGYPTQVETPEDEAAEIV